MHPLLPMLTYARPHQSSTEELFITEYLKPIPDIKQDEFGNLHVTRGKPRTLFSAHTDTVHRLNDRQTIIYDEECNVAFKDDNQPLGADNAAGVYVLLQLINAGIPGHYIFHRGEERGGIGSRWIAQNTPNVLKDLERAIAFDRRGFTDIITEQSAGVCCSNAFATTLAAEFHRLQPQLNYEPCDRGSFTDTASYIRLIPECTNISVGYLHEHTREEQQHLNHLDLLTQAVLETKWDSLPVQRDHTAPVVSTRRMFIPNIKNTNVPPVQSDFYDILDHRVVGEESVNNKWDLSNPWTQFLSDLAIFKNCCLDTGRTNLSMKTLTKFVKNNPHATACLLTMLFEDYNLPNLARISQIPLIFRPDRHSNEQPPIKTEYNKKKKKKEKTKAAAETELEPTPVDTNTPHTPQTSS